MNGARASRVTTHGLIVVANDLALNAANGWSSNFWISRANIREFSCQLPISEITIPQGKLPTMPGWIFDRKGENTKRKKVAHTAPIIQHYNPKNMLFSVLNADSFESLATDTDEEAELDLHVHFLRCCSVCFSIILYQMTHWSYDGRTGDDKTRYSTTESSRRVEPNPT